MIQKNELDFPYVPKQSVKLTDCLLFPVLSLEPASREPSGTDFT